jgi:hypothetical protein
MRNTIPWALAVLMLTSGCGNNPRASHMENASNDEPSQTTIRVDTKFGKRLSSDSTQIEDATLKFSTNETVFATVSIDGQVTGTLRARWLYVQGNDETPVGEQTVPLTGMNMNYHFSLVPPPGGLRPGQYRLQLLVNDQLVGLETIKVS